MGTSGKILVFVDLPGGELDETGRGLLSYGARLAGLLDVPWGAVTALPTDSAQLSLFGSYGTPTITAMLDCEALLDRPALLGKALAGVAKDEAIQVMILPHNDLGASLAPAIAQELDAAIITELVSARQSPEGVRLSRKALGVRIAETRIWDGSRPLVATVPPRSLSQVLMPTVRPGNPSLSTWRPAAPLSGAAAAVIGRIPPDPQTVDLTEAEVIFSVG
ncbi:MAG: electron transfer flavoprotein subunit alpha/FixB family protein, partial [Steroidobacteraceae bacterium]|nr:electron transfer flavoprotein subunit alpha/FixB family protein [Deltaproteobacteria bacterium]